MVPRDRRESRRDERETFGPKGTANRFQVRQKLVSMGDDYWIENDAGDRVPRVDGKAMRLRNTVDLGPRPAGPRVGVSRRRPVS